MPIVEYKCTSCNKRIEHLQKLGDKLAITCPYCKEDTLEKVFSAPSFVVVGGYSSRMKL